jgi:DNA polymerase-1
MEIFDLILKQRSYTKGVSMIASYLKASERDSILYPHINTNPTNTGRESSNNPNMQNISKEIALKTRFPVPARRGFRARPGHILVLGDYAGIEMRLIIEHTGEPELVELIQRNGDPHDLAAQIFYGELYTVPEKACAFTREIDPKRAKKVMRTAAKNAQFALAYGAGLQKIADTLMLSVVQAKPGHEAYCRRFPRVAGYTRKMARQAELTGKITTPFGRHLRIRADKPAAASNYMIQGTAAGILKRAQVRVDEYLRNADTDIRMLLPIHDELIFEVPRRELSQLPIVLREIERRMTEMSEIRVPLAVEWKMTNYTWDKAKEFNYA